MDDKQDSDLDGRGEGPGEPVDYMDIPGFPFPKQGTPEFREVVTSRLNRSVAA